MTTIYVETSVWSQAFADDAPELRNATLQFFDDARAASLELFISELVTQELEQAPPDLVDRFIDLVERGFIRLKRARP